MKIKNILFDFDGVILDSMPVRDKGFSLLFEGFDQDAVAKLVQYHRVNGGLSRYHKIRYFFENLLSQEITDEEIMAHAERFSVMMKKELVNPDLIIQDTTRFIDRNYSNFRMHVVSGSDGNELRFLCKELLIDKYFITIEGSPTPKTVLIKNLMEEHRYLPEETILVGDSINDYEAAIDNKIGFFGYRFHIGKPESVVNELKSMNDILLYCQ